MNERYVVYGNSLSLYIHTSMGSYGEACWAGLGPWPGFKSHQSFCKVLTPDSSRTLNSKGKSMNSRAGSECWSSRVRQILWPAYTYPQTDWMKKRKGERNLFSTWCLQLPTTLGEKPTLDECHPSTQFGEGSCMCSQSRTTSVCIRKLCIEWMDVNI